MSPAACTSSSPAQLTGERRPRAAATATAVTAPRARTLDLQELVHDDGAVTLQGDVVTQQLRVGQHAGPNDHHVCFQSLARPLEHHGADSACASIG